MRRIWLVCFALAAAVGLATASRANALPPPPSKGSTPQGAAEPPSGQAPKAEAKAEAATSAPVPPESQAATTAEPTTFEALARAAVPMSDLGTLLAPFAGKCDGETREIDRIRCRTTRAYLRKVIPRRSFWAVVDDPATIAVSDFDAGIKGYHLSVAGCLACTAPVTVGRTKEKRMITLKAPEKEAESLRAAVEVSRNAVGFDSLAEAKKWLDQSRPDLRTQFVFQPADTEWSFGPSRGYALKLLGMRVFNRCTGEILVSRPPSTGIADMPGMEEGCRRRTTGDDEERTPSAPAGMSPELTKNEISQAMATIRPQVFACFQKFKVPGLAQFEFVVAGNGTVVSVRLSGAFFGTPTGTCLIEAGQNARFPRFSRERQHFVYPFFLRE